MYNATIHRAVKKIKIRKADWLVHHCTDPPFDFLLIINLFLGFVNPFLHFFAIFLNVFSLKIHLVFFSFPWYNMRLKEHGKDTPNA